MMSWLRDHQEQNRQAAQEAGRQRQQATAEARAAFEKWKPEVYQLLADIGKHWVGRSRTYSTEWSSGTEFMVRWYVKDEPRDIYDEWSQLRLTLTQYNLYFVWGKKGDWGQDPSSPEITIMIEDNKPTFTMINGMKFSSLDDLKSFLAKMYAGE